MVPVVLVTITLTVGWAPDSKRQIGCRLVETILVIGQGQVDVVGICRHVLERAVVAIHARSHVQPGYD